MVQKKHRRIKKTIKKQNYKTGYAAGVFDLFHIGHINLLRNAKSYCDKLIVGVSSDDLVKYKNKIPIIPFNERIEIVRQCKFVDIAVPQYKLDKIEMIKKLKADFLFVGDDWYNNKNWKIMEKKLDKLNCRVIYFPYTRGVSTTLINNILNVRRKKLSLSKQYKFNLNILKNR